ncbi:hypothetical protein EXIGLDRAFT_758865 [Exidia glandulosa HHB12029]|uniref:Protein kinase domain-containing protein n=1 Tax=Exidia glandulosa HHB12029 TaxID=1314781 RepID=A0A165QF29_EXIGL|nr:hypothetical protein EXIGLDRAFT_758865 [Exidia glandulosa HHB12029]
MKIIGKIQAGRDLHAQVYVASLGDLKVAVKIYQTSWTPPGSISLLSDNAVNLIDQPEASDENLQLFHREHWAYKRMLPIQGVVVPHVHGFFEVSLPHGEPAIALVLEYIPAMHPKSYVTVIGKKNEDGIGRLGSELALAVHAIHSCDVDTLDLSSRNVLLPNDDPASPILIDFAVCTSLRNSVLHLSVPNIVRTLCDIGFSQDIIIQWMRERLTESAVWRELFDVPSDDWDWVEQQMLHH